MTREAIILTINDKQYPVIKLHGHGMCSCYGCEQKRGWNMIWTDWCYEYKEHVYCYDCLKELLEGEK